MKININLKILIAVTVSMIALLLVVLGFSWYSTINNTLEILENTIDENIIVKADNIVNEILNDESALLRITQSPGNTLNPDNQINTAIIDKLKSHLDINTGNFPLNIFIVSNKGSIICHNSKTTESNIANQFSYFEKKYKITDIISTGASESFNGKNKNKQKVFLIIKPLRINKRILPWSIITEINTSLVLSNYRSTFLISALIGILITLGALIVFYFITKILRKSVTGTKERLYKISRGEIQDVNELKIDTGDEYEELANAVNKAAVNLKNIASFAKQIGSGDLNSEFSPVSENDLLGNSLVEMRQSLKHAKDEEEQRIIEDTKRNWTTEGLAKFVEILRSNSEDLKELSYNIMSNLITYLKANQGALFVVDETDEDNIQLELVSTIAYERDKYIKRKIGIGEELVGQCAFEKETIYMTDIPDNYINITSGLGHASPRSLLLVPLLMNEDVFGVIEIASFKEFEDYQIDFIKRIGESIASTISTVKTNEKTSKLLNQSKQQAEELAAQEEEMRQNMEELQATQEEAHRREYEMTDMINALSKAALTVEYDMDGTIISVNEKYTDLLGMSASSVVGKNHKEGYDFSKNTPQSYQEFWMNLRKGIPQKEINKVIINNKTFWLEENYTPVARAEGEKPHKVFKISFDITEQKLREEELLNYNADITKKNESLAETEIQSLKEKYEELQKAYEKEKQLNKIDSEQEQKKIDKEEVKEKSKTEKTKVAFNKKKSEPAVNEDGNIEWNDDLILGIQEIDQQHEQLIRLANQISDNFKLKKSKKEIKDSLKNIIDFASYHFGTEEEYFAQSNYSKSAEHIQEHKTFTKKLKTYQSEYASNKKTADKNISAYIQLWIKNHISIEDKLYVDEFEKLGLK